MAAGVSYRSGEHSQTPHRERCMATYDVPVNPTAFSNMESGRKTVYAVLADPTFQGICSGDRIEFGSMGAVSVGMVRRYASLESLVAAEGWQNLVPEASSSEVAIADVRAVPEWNLEKEKEVGVYALRVRDTKRKLV
jgi:ASC-1-like (ASCH) protein